MYYEHPRDYKIGFNFKFGQPIDNQIRIFDPESAIVEEVIYLIKIQILLCNSGCCSRWSQLVMHILLFASLFNICYFGY